MKHCTNCNRDFSDFIEVCPECVRVLSFSRKKTRSASGDAGKLQSITPPKPRSAPVDPDERVLYTGSRADVEYLKSILDSHNVPSAVRSAHAGAWDLTVTGFYVDAAEELLEDIYPSTHRYETFEQMEDLDDPMTQAARAAGGPSVALPRIVSVALFFGMIAAVLFGMYALIRGLLE